LKERLLSIYTDGQHTKSLKYSAQKDRYGGLTSTALVKKASLSLLPQAEPAWATVWASICQEWQFFSPRPLAETVSCFVNKSGVECALINIPQLSGVIICDKGQIRDSDEDVLTRLYGL